MNVSKIIEYNVYVCARYSYLTKVLHPNSLTPNPAQKDFAQRQNSLPLIRKKISGKGRIVISFSYLYRL